MIISLGALTTLIYLALGVSTFSVFLLIALVLIDFKRGNLW